MINYPLCARGFPWFSLVFRLNLRSNPIHASPATRQKIFNKVQGCHQMSGRMLGKVLHGGSPSFHPRFTHLFRRLSQHDSWCCSIRCRLARQPLQFLLVISVISQFSATKSPGFLVTSCNILVLELLESTWFAG